MKEDIKRLRVRKTEETICMNVDETGVCANRELIGVPSDLSTCQVVSGHFFKSKKNIY